MHFLTIYLLLICLSFAYVKIPLKKVYKEQLITSNATLSYMNEFLSTSYLKNSYNSVYSAQIYAGTPPQLFTVAVGTAAPYLWIPSKKCQNVCHAASNYFDSSKSSTYQNLGKTITIAYSGSAFAKGDLSKETFSIGDTSALTVKGQLFTLVYQDAGLSYATYDGVLGLTYGSALGYPSFLENLKLNGQISKKVFSVYLYDNDFVGDYYDGSSIIFGGYDLASYAQSTEIQYVDIFQKDGFWNLQVSNIKANNVPLSNQVSQVYIDVGTSWIYTSKAVFDTLYDKLSTHGSCELENNVAICDCYNYPLSGYPSISFVFGSKYTFSLEPEHYFAQDGKYCILLWSYSEDSFWIFGDVFLRKYYTIFDAEFKQIGFTLAKNRKNTKFISFSESKSSINNGSKASNIENEIKTEKEKSLENRSQSSSNSLYWAFSGVLFGFLSGFIYFSYKKKKENAQEIYYQKIQA